MTLWLTRKGRTSDNIWLKRVALAALPTIFLASSAGWVFTEMGRQPWVVAPHPNPEGADMVWQRTMRGVSTQVSAGSVVTSLVLFTLLYGVLAVGWYRLMHRYIAGGAEDAGLDAETPATGGDGTSTDVDRPLSFAY